MNKIDLDSHLSESLAAIEAARDLESLKTLDTELLGKNSATTSAKKNLGQLDPEERKVEGKRVL